MLKCVGMRISHRMGVVRFGLDCHVEAISGVKVMFIYECRKPKLRCFQIEGNCVALWLKAT